MDREYKSKISEDVNIKSIFLGFDFYGSGNIGDDLMIAGFYEALSTLNHQSLPKIFAQSKYNLASQKLRFPKINWMLNAQEFNGFDDFNNIDCWAGVGDTPFQLTIGDWFLKFLLDESKKISQYQRKVLIGVGCEGEIKPKLKEFSQIANLFDKISVRDEHSYNIIVNWLKVPCERVFLGSDLANISLSRIFGGNRIASREFSLGLIITGDRLSKEDIRVVKTFIEDQKSIVAFIAGETRKIRNSECDIFSNLAKFPWSKFKSKSVLKKPDYNVGSLYDLVQPISACETIISTRYHGLMSAAWAGCKVAAIARSSKVLMLARELNVPYCELPLTRNKLDRLLEEAKPVSREILTTKKTEALAGVSFSLDVI